MKYVCVLAVLLLNACSHSAPVVYLNEEISEPETEQFLRKLKVATRDLQPEETVEIRISSGGGSVYQGLRIIEAFQYLKSKNIKIKTVCVDMCMSMAAHIYMMGDVREATSTAVIMFHHIYNPMMPDARTLWLVSYQHTFLPMIAERLGTSEQVLLLLFKMQGEIYISAQDGKRMGVIHNIVALPF